MLKTCHVFLFKEIELSKYKLRFTDAVTPVSKVFKFLWSSKKVANNSFCYFLVLKLKSCPKKQKVKLGLKKFSNMLPSYFDYIFVH